MTIHENLRFTCTRLVSEYGWNGHRCTDTSYWEILKIIKIAFNINAISKDEAERYCYNMDTNFEEMMTA